MNKLGIIFRRRILEIGPNIESWVSNFVSGYSKNRWLTSSCHKCTTSTVLSCLLTTMDNYLATPKMSPEEGQEIISPFTHSQARTIFVYQSSYLWAALPDQVKSSRNESSFKKQCKNWVKHNIMVKP